MRFLSKIIISQNLPPPYKDEATHFGSLAQQIPLNGKEISLGAWLAAHHSMIAHRTPLYLTNSISFY